MRIHVTGSIISGGVDLRGKVLDSNDTEGHGITLEEMNRWVSIGKATEATESMVTNWPDATTRVRGRRRRVGNPAVLSESTGDTEGTEETEPQDEETEEEDAEETGRRRRRS